MNNTFYIFLLFFSSAVCAQRFQGGVMVGLVGSQVDGDGYAGYNRIGLHGGAFTKTKFNNNTGAQMEINYISKGAREKHDEPDPFFHKLNLHYIEVPLLLEYYINDNIFPELGISPSLLMTKSLEDANGKIPSSQIPDYKGFDLGGIIGINYQFHDRWIGNIRYTYSLISIHEHINDNDYYYNFFAKILGYDQGDYNNVLSIGVYYIIGK